MNQLNCTHCYYQRGQTSIVDLVHPVSGLTWYGGKNAEQIQIEYPGSELMLFDDALKLIEIAEVEKFVTPVSEISKEDYWEMLGVLPPVKWTISEDNQVESFKMSERTSGVITGIYARIGERYFHLSDSIFTSHEEIIKRCNKFMMENGV